MPGKNIAVKVALLSWGLAAAAVAHPLIVGAERFPEQAGAVLYNELGCANCHPGAAGGGPRRQGPDLQDLSKRVDHDWLIGFLRAPEHERMPRMFEAIPEDQRDQAIRDVAAWLGTLDSKLKFKPFRHANAERGSALYHEVGCVACHAPTADFKPRRPASPIAVPLPDLKKKTSLAALGHFLANTNRYRPDNRMPQIPLVEQDAIDIAAHLVDFQSSDPRDAPLVKPWPKADNESIKRGGELVASLNCAACHDLPGLKAKPLQPIEEMAGHCLDGNGTVRFNLSGKQREALVKFLPETKKDQTGLLLERLGSPLHEVATLGGLNCYACHEREGRGGPLAEADPFFVGDPALGDAGRIPPPLTMVGRKLRVDWLEKAVRGDPATRVRPYLKTRMPVYPPQYAILAHDPILYSGDAIREDVGGIWTLEELEKMSPRDVAKVDDLEAGRKLLGTNGGAGCITCHRWGDRPSLGMQGLDLAELDQRLIPSWFRGYLIDPAKYRKGTLMPALWPEGKSTIKDVLDGDTEKQIGAIWAFIRDGKGLPEGHPKTNAGEFELVPTDRPIVQRAFMEGVGTHAILVGFPGGINLAYDGEKAEPRLVWRGRFFDAYNTWFSRFPPMEKPLEKQVYRFGENKDGRKFLGYRLDEAGNPTFLVRVKGLTFEEQFSVNGKQLVRAIRIGGNGEVSSMHPEGLEASTDIGEDPETFTTTYSWK